MRIDLISEHASPLALIGGVDAGGQNVHVAALAKGLADLGAEVVVHTRRNDPHTDPVVKYAGNVLVHHVDAGPASPVPKDELLPYMPKFAEELRRWWVTDKPDVVHAHFWMSGYAASLAAAMDRVPVALTFHAMGIEKRLHQGTADTSPPERIKIESSLSRAVDLVIATTDAERSLLVDMGADSSKVTVIPCGVDRALFGPVGPMWQNPSGRRYVVCASRLVPRKGIADVIRALAQLNDVDLVVAGGPPEAMLGDDPEAVRLRLLAEQLGVDDRVSFLGALGREEIAELYRGATAVCCTPWYEPFGLVAVEAMACGVPVVASRVGGLAETVLDHTTGKLVDPHDSQAIAMAIAEIVADPVREQAMRQASVERSRRYDWSAVSANTLASLNAIASHNEAELTATTQSGLERTA